MDAIGIILAAGRGNRMNSSLPKQLINIHGKTVLDYSIEAFQTNCNIAEITVVANPDYIDEITQISSKYSKVNHIIAGGKERYLSSILALNLYKGKVCKVLIHDGVRPMVSQKIINSCLEALDNYCAVTTAIPSTDTILISDNDGKIISNIPNRATTFRCQTPQGFISNILADAYEKAITEGNIIATDDCGIIKKYRPDIDIRLIYGDNNNIKITYPEDIILIDKIIKNS